MNSRFEVIHASVDGGCQTFIWLIGRVWLQRSHVVMGTVIRTWFNRVFRFTGLLGIGVGHQAAKVAEVCIHGTIVDAVRDALQHRTCFQYVVREIYRSR
jgi:hypothetical protein